MSWYFSLAILVVINSASVILTKVASNKISNNSVGVFYQYLFSALIINLYVILVGKADIGIEMIWVGSIGFMCALGNYCQWRASALSLSKTVLFFPFFGIVAIVLAAYFLNEVIFWNLQLALGIGLCFSAMWLFMYRAKDVEAKNKLTQLKTWLFLTLSMVLIFGIASFLEKLSSFTVPLESFLMVWYNGAFLGAFFIFLISRQKLNQERTKTVLMVLPVVLSNLLALAALYWTYQLGGPITLVLPIQGLAITLIPILAGWWLFGERKGLSLREWIGFVVGIIGAMLVLLR